MPVVCQAGRPGMSIGCVSLPSTPYSELSATSYGGYRPSDQRYIGLLSEFKTNFNSLTKAVHTTRIGGHMYTYYYAIYGGYLSGVDGLAIAVIVVTILLNQAYMGTTCVANAEHPFQGFNTRSELLSVLNAVPHVFTRNSNLMPRCHFRSVGIQGTRTMLFENTAFLIIMTASGVSLLTYGHTATDKHAHYASGLEARFATEMAQATSGISCEDVDEIVKQAVARY